MSKPKGSPINILLIVGVLLVSYNVLVIGYYYFSNFNFTVLTITRVCEQPLNNRCSEEIVVSDETGTVRKASFLFHQLPSQPFQTKNNISKPRFQLDYFVNTKLQKWPFAVPVAEQFFGGLLSIGIWFVARRNGGGAALRSR